MRKFVGVCLATSWLAMGAVPANAAVVIEDFNNVTVNNVASLTIGRVTYTSLGSLVSTAGPNNSGGHIYTPNGTPGLLSFNPVNHRYYPILATIAGGTNFVSIELGTFGGAANTLFLSAYDAGGNFIGSVYDSYSSLSITIKTLSFSAPYIGSVAFGSQYPNAGTVADNFAFETGVPEPASWAMLIAGFGLIGAALRRKRATYRMPEGA